ncbi:hypothetical protein LAUMK191_04108 [Mycobacterium attenuatum]|uniref:hypothetical protein n=1 Tax=Mycobacterium attenuatum TaxID=2341086 RepID=UPI000F03BCCB|nr:hypothetical protein [Mycobacterium attenuatum]VBA57638.1 hypothetical protein LAUMK191_04108 [Mycobacterium attenuatum]
MELLKWVIGILLTLGSIVATIMIYRYTNRRKQLQIHTRIENLFVARVGPKDPLELRYEGRLVQNPYIIDFAASNTGHKDIASKDFDSEKPLQVGIHAEVIARMRIPQSGSSQILQVSDDSRSVLLQPSKIAKGAHYHIRLLVAGKPRIVIPEDHPLIDTDITTSDKKVERERKIAARFGMGVLALCFASFLTLESLLLFEKSFGLQRGSILFLDDGIVGPVWAVVVFWLIVVATILAGILTIFTMIDVKRNPLSEADSPHNRFATRTGRGRPSAGS